LIRAAEEGPVPLEPSKANVREIVLIETTRAIHMCVPMSAPPFGIYGNNTQNAAVADKHQIELAVSLLHTDKRIGRE
jgi:hypothetical protein